MPRPKCCLYLEVVPAECGLIIRFFGCSKRFISEIDELVSGILESLTCFDHEYASYRELVFLAASGEIEDIYEARDAVLAFFGDEGG